MSLKKTYNEELKWKKIKIENIIQREDNIYPIIDLYNLVESIQIGGLLQNLVVRETVNPNEYMLIIGARRVAAIKYILENRIQVAEKIQDEIKNPMCLILAKHENFEEKDLEKLMEKYYIHESNINIRR